MSVPRIRVTYDIVTPESAEQGDFAETGFIDEEGILVDVDEDGSAVCDAVDILRREGPLEASSSPFQPGAWYTQADGDTDYRSGAVTRKSFHLVDFTSEEEISIYKNLKCKHAVL